MKRFVVVLAAACSGHSATKTAGPALAEPAASNAPTSACYQGTSTGAGQRVQSVVRRTLDPANKQIVEDVVRGDAGDLKAFRVVMTVTGNTFTMAEAGGQFSGTGKLIGPSWAWTQWESNTQQQVNGATLEVESHEELTPTGLLGRKAIKQGDKIVATTIDELTTMDCASWDTARKALATPVLDDALCERSCRRFATIRFIAATQDEIAKLPADKREAAIQDKTRELEGKLAAGLPECVKQCRAANNVKQTACFARAENPQDIGACDK